MASVNPFDLLGDDDNDDPSQLIAKKALTPISAPPQQQPKAQGKLPSKPLPPAQAVRETKTGGRGGDREGGAGRGYGSGSRGGGAGNRGGGAGYNRDRVNNENSVRNNGVSGGFGGGGGGGGGYAPTEDGEVDKSSDKRGGYGGPRGAFRPGRRGGYNNGEFDGERPRRVFDRHSGTGRGNTFKKEGSGRGNWGSATDEATQETEELGNANEKSLTPEKQPGEDDVAADASKETPANEPEEKEPEDKEMTLDEYEKIKEEKRKALLALKVEERKVPVDKEFESMQQLSGKKTNHEIFIKLGSEKDKRKEIADKEEKAKKAVSINEFLKPAGGGDGKYFPPGGRGRGRGRGGKGGSGRDGGGSFSGNVNVAAAPSIEDPGQFPNLK